MKVHDWLDAFLDKTQGAEDVCFDVRSYVRNYKTNAEYYSQASDPRVFLTALAFRQPDVAFDVIRHIVSKLSLKTMHRPVKMALRAVADPGIKRGRLEYHLDNLRKSNTSSPLCGVAKLLLQWRAGRSSPRALWFVVQALTPSAESQAVLMDTIRALVPFEIWEAGLVRLPSKRE